jgi:hypothetical protein
MNTTVPAAPATTYANPGVRPLLAMLRADDWWLERNRMMIALAEALEHTRAAADRQRVEAGKHHDDARPATRCPARPAGTGSALRRTVENAR